MSRAQYIGVFGTFLFFIGAMMSLRDHRADFDDSISIAMRAAIEDVAATNDPVLDACLASHAEISAVLGQDHYEPSTHMDP